MASILRRLRSEPALERSAWPQASFQQYVDFLTFQGHNYGLTGSMSGSKPETPDPHFVGYVRSIHQKNGVVSAAVVARALLLSQLRFVWRNTRASATPGRLYGAASLGPLERPGSTTRPDLLFRLELDVSYAGNAYGVRRGNEITRLRPDWVSVVLGSDLDPDWDGDTMVAPSDAKEIGIIYQPQGAGKKGRPEVFMTGEYFHWMPEPDPVDFWRGASWVTSVIREISTDGQVSDHQSKFFANAATPNLVFMMDPTKTPDQVKHFADLINERHSGSSNSYRNMFLGGGTDVKVVGSDLSALSLKDVSGGFEARITARSRVPAVVLGTREGLAGSSLNSGNYAQTRRLWADGWFSPTAQNLCASLESVMAPANDSELWYDAAEVLFLQEDQKDAAEIIQMQMAAIRQGVDAGFEPDAIVEAVTSWDASKLRGRHTGLTSVQLTPPASGADVSPKETQ